MTTIPGVDYAWSHPGGAALQKAGKKFAARYLSHDPAKNLTRAEADDLAAHGVSCVVVWESTASRALSGRSGGIADAHDAVAQATAAGMPAGRPVFFAVDFDATASQQAAINAYLDGAASVLGAARVGVYGGYYPVKRALDAGYAAWAWQTAAWSGGHWDPRAVIRQGAQATINAVACDLNTATAADYGQWMPGQPTPEDDDMPLTKTDVELLLSTPMDDPTDPGTKQITVRGALWAAGRDAFHAAADAQKALAQIGALSTPSLTDAQVTAMGVQVAANPVLAAAIAKAVVDLEAKRLDS